MPKGPLEFQSKTANPQYQGVQDISPEELLAKKSLVKIIDVRRPDEYEGELGHIADAELLTLDYLPMKINELSREVTIVFVCRSGARSAQATAFALEHGFSQVYNLKGGMLQWNALGLAIEGGPNS